MASTMANRGRAQDRSKVAGGQEHKVRYEAKKTGASAAGGAGGEERRQLA